VETRLLRPKFKLLSIVSFLILIAIAIGTLWLSQVAASAVRQKNANQFAWDSHIISNHLQNNLEGYSNALYGGRAFILNSNVVTSAEWTGYYRNQDIFNRLNGLNSISYIQLVPAASVDQFVAQKRQQPEIGPSYTVSPAGSRGVYALGALAVGATDNLKPNGFDVYSTPDRRAVYQLAPDTGLPAASGETNFTDGNKGMFIALALNREGATAGYVVAAVHSNNFFSTVIDETTLGVVSARVIDVTDSKKPNMLYSTAKWNDHSNGMSRTDKITFAGRQWKVEYQAPKNYTHHLISTVLPYVVLFCGLLLISSLGMMFYIFFKTVPISKLQFAPGEEKGKPHSGVKTKSTAKASDPHHIVVTTNVDLDP
jgi:CHASE1-domain containing sensor protein